MGRKGIGKLSLFSIADTIEVYTRKDSSSSAFRMNAEEIRELIRKEEKAMEESGGDPDGFSEHSYRPDPIDTSHIDFDRGTRIVLTDLKKNLSQTEKALRKRLARRFSIIGQEHGFDVQVNGEAVTIEDRDYFHKLEYLWTYDEATEDPLSPSKLARNKKASFLRSGTLPDGYTVTGWIGTVEKPAQLKDANDNLNKIVVMVRGKVAQEDILEDFNEGGIYTKYLIGEIHADFLDRDDLVDIATSSRQRIVEDDERYVLLRNFLQGELRHIEGEWTKQRNKRGKEKAFEIPAIKAWYESLGPDLQKRAESLFGKINQLPF